MNHNTSHHSGQNLVQGVDLGERKGIWHHFTKSMFGVIFFLLILLGAMALFLV